MVKNYFIPTEQNNNKPYLLRKIAIVAYSILLIFVNTMGGFLGIEEAYASTITPGNIISLTNKERSAGGLNTLSNNPKLASAALAKANDMLEKQYWDHFGPNGETPWQFIRASGYAYVYAGENLAKGFRTSEGVVEAWMASPTHKANIMSGNYKDIGIAVVEGQLLGKQTILVVQMFGNLTSSVQGVAESPKPKVEKPSVPTKPKVVTGDSKVVTPKEQGEIRSIQILSPENGATYMDPGMNVKGQASNIEGEYIIDVVEGDKVIGSTKSNRSTWEVEKGSDWSEGEHKIVANLNGTEVKSQEISFTMDSTAPKVDLQSVMVEDHEEQYVLKFNILGDWDSINIILGSEILPVVETKGQQSILASIPKDKDTSSVFINLADKVGNSSSVDISEYFLKEETEEDTKSRIIPIIGLSIKDGINIGIVLFVFILLIVEIFIYAKKGQLKQATGDLFTVGAWWLVISVAIFNGFSGIIT